MSYEIKTHGNMGEAVRKLARKEIRKAIANLNPRNSPAAVDVPHTARKHFKKLRALLRFVRLEISSASFRTENDCFREAGRKLRALRDSEVLVKSVDRLQRHFFRGESTPLLTQTRRKLAREAEQAASKTAEDCTVEEVLRLLREAMSRVKSWELAEFRWKEARRAIQRSYRQCRRAFRIAAKDPTVENLHAWRKRAKDLWYHARLVRRASPEAFSGLTDELHALTELIGDDHDFAMLCESIERKAPAFRGAKGVEPFLTLVHIRRQELQHAAFALAERLFAQRVSLFGRRIAAGRKLWRKNSRLAGNLESTLAEINS